MLRENLLTIIFMVIAAGLGAWQLVPRLTQQKAELIFVQPDISVSISGAVQQAGRYELPWGAQIADLIQLAGGLGHGAEETLVNYAQVLTTGQAVVIPFKQHSDGDRISLNSAAQWELERLPGIGPALAGRIIQHRPFFKPEDLLDVTGIGEATLTKLLPLVKP